jgi:hypothetical protein
MQVPFPGYFEDSMTFFGGAVAVIEGVGGRFTARIEILSTTIDGLSVSINTMKGRGPGLLRLEF